jgi:hypothetical protein
MAMRMTIEITIDPDDSRYAEVRVTSDTGRDEHMLVRRTDLELKQMESVLDKIRAASRELAEHRKLLRLRFGVSPHPAFQPKTVDKR